MGKTIYPNRHGSRNANWRGGYESKCSECGSTVWVKPSRIHKKQRFCSKPCHYQWMRVNNLNPNSGVSKTCEGCGKVFRISQSLSDRGEGKFCSQACMGISYRTRIKGNCKQCGVVMDIQQYRIGQKLYCSRECSNLGRTKIRSEQEKCRIKIDRSMSSCMSYSLKGEKRGRRWETLVNYTLDELVERLKSTMPDGYEWPDYMNGLLHIDHIIPRTVYHYKTTEDFDFHRCWGLDNLQLLPAVENMRKGAKLAEPFQPTLF